MSQPDVTSPIPVVPGSSLPPIDRWALFLDIDGTLLDIAPTPGSVTIPPGLTGMLQKLLERFQGALAILSGRRLASIDSIVAPLAPAAAGQHGAEIRRHPGASVEMMIDPAKVVAVAGALEDLSAQFPGVIIENKGQSVAVHFRSVPEAEPEIRRRVLEQTEVSAGAFEALYGKMVWDLHPTGVTKGTALELLLAAPPFLGRTPVVIGDDTTDEFGFETAKRQGGVGIRVGPGATAASFRLSNPESCRRWLGSLVAANA